MATSAYDGKGRPGMSPAFVEISVIDKHNKRSSLLWMRGGAQVTAPRPSSRAALIRAIARAGRVE